MPHGVALGLGGADRPDPGRLAALAARAELLGAPLVTEHIAFVRSGGPLTASPGLEAGHLLPVPRTWDALDVLCENVRIAQDSLPVPLAPENIAALITWPDEELRREGQVPGVEAWPSGPGCRRAERTWPIRTVRDTSTSAGRPLARGARIELREVGGAPAPAAGAEAVVGAEAAAPEPDASETARLLKPGAAKTAVAPEADAAETAPGQDPSGLKQPCT
ncbi:hypothetical protein SCALM49S_00692 [Streptomyces californicus]